MAGEHSDQPSAGNDDSDEGAAGGLEPTGGPRRVVSEQSVDDILASLEETTDSTESTESTEPTEPTEPTPQATAVRSEATDLPDPHRLPTSGSDVDEAVGCGDSDDCDDVDDHDDRDDVDDHDDRDDVVEDDDLTSDQLNDLADCLEPDEITGSDVRAAETGDGREPTPDVGDLDLSMDDLKRTAAELDGDSIPAEPSEAPSDSQPVPDDAGPLAEATDSDRTEPAASGDSKETTGILGRLKRLFSR